MNYLNPKLETPIKVRVRGQENGGWNGDPQWIGFVTFVSPKTETGLPSIVKLNIGGIGPSQLELETIERPSADDFEFAVEGRAPDGEYHRFDLVVHRDWIGKGWEPTEGHLGVPNHPEGMTSTGLATPEIAKYSTSSQKPVEAPKPPETFEYTPDEGDTKLINLWETMVSNPGYATDPIFVRTVAVAVLRRAIMKAVSDHEPDKVVFYPRVVSRRAVKHELKSMLEISGMHRFAHVADKAMSLQVPPEGPDRYDWGRMVEQFIAPPSEMKIECVKHTDASAASHATGDPAMDEGLKDALGAMKKLLGIMPEPPKGPTPGHLT